MDTVTHGLAGYVIAKTGLTGDTGRWGTAAGVAASLFPDIDTLGGTFLGAEFTLKYHRGLTNSLFLVVPLSLLFAWIFVRLSGKRKFWTFFSLCAVEILAHTFLDLATSFGTMILSPFSDRRFALDWLFIIDPVLTGTLLAALAATFIWGSREKALARVSVALVALYITLCAGSHFQALSLAEAHARDKVVPVLRTASLPQPLSPFHWANFVVTAEEICEGHVNLIGKRSRSVPEGGNLFARIWSRYQPVSELRYRCRKKSDDSPWIERALAEEGVRMFSWFARFPIARYARTPGGRHRVSFTDLRFGVIDGRNPFVYEIVFTDTGEIVSQGIQRVQYTRGL